MPHLLSNQARSHPGVECVEVIKAVQDSEARGLGLKAAGMTRILRGIRPVCSFLALVALFSGATDMSHFRVHWPSGWCDGHAFCSSVPVRSTLTFSDVGRLWSTLMIKSGVNGLVQTCVVVIVLSI